MEKKLLILAPALEKMHPREIQHLMRVVFRARGKAFIMREAELRLEEMTDVRQDKFYKKGGETGG